MSGLHAREDGGRDEVAVVVARHPGVAAVELELRAFLHALLDEINNLTINRSLEAVRDVADDFFADVNRLLTNRSVKRDGLLDGIQ